MKRNPRCVLELAEFLKVPAHQLISYTPARHLLKNNCGTCRYFRDNVCDIGDGNPVETMADCHSCGHYKRTKQVPENDS